ncbi:MAG: cupredoxin domain-containing protein [Actinomycetota bacterium]
MGGVLAGLLSITVPMPASGAEPASEGPATRVGSPVIVAVPGSRGATYATPVIVAQPGDEITFVNAEPFVHDVRSVAMGPDDTPWCNPWDPDEPRHRKRNPRQFPKGKCPLLWSLPISMTVGAVETKVYGTKNLVPGTTVDFYCTVFPNMRGTVIVQ